MSHQNRELDYDFRPTWFHALLFIALGLIGYAGWYWFRGNYLDALVMPLIIGFVWLAGMKQKLAWGIALVAFYIMLTVPLMSMGYMSWHLISPILSTVLYMVLGIALYKLPLHKSAVLVAFVIFCLLLLYGFNLVDKITFVTTIIGVGAGLLSVYLFPELRQSVSQKD